MSNSSDVTQHDGFCVWENIWIPLSDGRKLSARVWMPDTAATQEDGPSPVPAIFEYLPYRKRDGTAQRDESTYPVFAKAGYAGVRVDISGTGESDGVFDDEYSPRELSDGVEVINWIAQQSWCTGEVGMMGISWGGFNGLQIAALRPEPLKAVISIGSTVDRYNADIHYKSGCHLNSNLSWSGVMQCYANRPPDPAIVGDRWREMWLERLNGANLILDEWLSHQRYDDFWKHGSIEQDYSDLEIPSLVISGWADAYKNAPPSAAENMPGLAKAMNGPWVHKYPHFAYPHPRADFHDEALKWWDHWLLGKENEVEAIPAYRAYISENVKPSMWREREEGRWIAEEQWPSGSIKDTNYYLNNDHSLALVSSVTGLKKICSPEDTGIQCGEVFALKPDAETPGDQRLDDAGSLVFETGVLDQSVEILGQPRLKIKVAIDAPLGNLAVRLIDVHPDGTSHRVSFGVLNLAHRSGNETPTSMSPGEEQEIIVTLDHTGYRFVPGHQIRVSISTAYWPLIMPTPYHVTATLNLDGTAAISLPVRGGQTNEEELDQIEVSEPTDPNPLPEYPQRTPGTVDRYVKKDLANNQTHYVVEEDTGESEIPGHGLHVRHTRYDKWSINPDDPIGTTGLSKWSSFMSRGEWKIHLDTEVSMIQTKDEFEISGWMKAFDKGELIFEREYQKTILRDHM